MDLPELAYSYTLLQKINDISFTKREIDIMACIAQGRTSRKSIAAFLDTKHKPISYRTVEHHIQNIIHKLNGSSWEDIRETIESLDRISLFRKHYEIIKFDHMLQDILLHFHETIDFPINVYLYCNNDQNFKFKQDLEEIIQYLYYHKLSITLKIVSKNSTLDILSDNDISQNQYIIYDETHYSPPNLKNQNIYYFNYSQNNDAYIFILFLLKRLSKNQELILQLENQLEKFHEQASNLDSVLPQTHKLISKKIWAIITVTLSMVPLLSLPIKKFYFSQELVVRSDLHIPSASIFLERHNIAKQIKDKLFSNSVTRDNTVPLVVLVGIGGSGKTVFARALARRVKIPITWEINAETRNTLFNSLNELAQTLAVKLSEKAELSNINQINDLEQRRKLMLSFIKRSLKQQSEWLLIFDNVESFSQISECLPIDSAIWGNGHVILTTQNAYMKEAELIEHKNVVAIEPLSLEEAIQLFSNICYKQDPRVLSKEQLETLKDFLPKIPMFPLDISIAAKYISVNKTSFSEYLRNLQSESKTFYIAQEDVLKETSSYIKSRYSVITLTLKELIQTVPESIPLLWSISLLDSQHIPTNLLIKQSSAKITNALLHAMRKFSLISIDGEQNIFNTVSIHRSTQSILRAYLMDLFHFSATHPIVVTTNEKFSKYVKSILEEENLKKINFILPHCEIWRNNSPLTPISEGMLLSNLGALKYHLGNNKEAKIELERSLEILKNSGPSPLFMAQAQTYLGSLYAKAGNIQYAKNYLENALKIYTTTSDKLGYSRALSFLGYTYMAQDDIQNAIQYFNLSVKQFNKNSKSLIFARTLIYLGLIHKEQMAFEEAIAYFQQAISIFLEVGDLINVGWVKGYLGITYREMGDYPKSRTILEESVQYYRQNNATKHNALGVILLGLGNCYRNLGLYTKAAECFSECEQIYENNGSDINLAWCHAHQGRLNLKMNNLETAQQLLEKGQRVFEKIYGTSNLRTAWLYLQLGRLYSQLGQFFEAKAFMEKSLHIYLEKLPNNYPRISKIRVNMGILQYHMGNYQLAQSILEKNLPLYDKFYGSNHVQTAVVLLHLSKVYKALGENKKARMTFKKANKIFSFYKHPDQDVLL
jgi:tetratricopeptide (TPR) repeat protein/DNA-binding CsgD family transcriptional regulator